MTLVIREADVRRLLTMPDAIDALDIAFRDYATGQAQNVARQRIVLHEPRGVLHVLPAAVPAFDAVGFKAYTAFATGVRFVVNLYAASTGELRAIIEADWLGRMRTGAASGLATKYLARDDARTLALIGSGGQAETQLLAIAAVRPLTEVRVTGRDHTRLTAFCTRLAELTGIRVVPTASAEAAVRGADIIATATTAREPVVLGEWLAPGMHINAMGSNWADRREIDTAAVTSADVIVADSVEQAQIEAGDLIIPARENQFAWDRVTELSAVVADPTQGRTNPTQITLFKSLGIGLEDMAVAARIYALARAQGVGEELRLFDLP